MDFFDAMLLARLGIKSDNHGKRPEVVIFLSDKNWLLLIESAAGRGPVDAKRQGELSKLLGSGKPGLVFVSAFPTRKTFAKYHEVIAWESEVWIADAPSQLIQFNGARFLGPYEWA